MKGYFEMQWESEHHQPKEKFNLEWLEEELDIKLPEDFKDFQYRNNNAKYPDRNNCVLFDRKGEIVVVLPVNFETYLGLESIMEFIEINKEDFGEIYYWHLPITEIGPEKVILDYTHCKENPPVVWVDEESGPYEDALGSKHWKRYIAPTFKDFIEMIGDRNKPVGDYIDINLMADGTVVSDEEAEKMPRQ